MTLPLRIAIVGAGPAGIYAADILTGKDPEARVDIFDRLPTPYGLIRYGVAPDHPRIKQIVVALHRVLENERIRFIGNVHVGVDVKVDELRQFYDAVIFATGAEQDRSLHIPARVSAGRTVPPSSSPDRIASRSGPSAGRARWPSSAWGTWGWTWPGCSRGPATSCCSPTFPARWWPTPPSPTVHMFARRGPAQAKFTPVETAGVGSLPTFRCWLPRRGWNSTPSPRPRRPGASRCGWSSTCSASGRCAIRSRGRTGFTFISSSARRGTWPSTASDVGLRTERQELTGDGTVCGRASSLIGMLSRSTGRSATAPRRSRPARRHPPAILPNDGGRVLDLDGNPLPGIYATGWVNSGPVGLIGHTEAAEPLARAPQRADAALDALLTSKGMHDFAGWDHRRPHSGRIKVASRAASRFPLAARPSTARIRECGVSSGRGRGRGGVRAWARAAARWFSPVGQR